MATWITVCAAALGGLLLVEGARFARRRRRLSIHGMLNAAQPCAVRRPARGR